MRCLLAIILTLTAASPAGDFAAISLEQESLISVHRAPGQKSPLVGTIPSGSLGLGKTGKERQVFVDDGYEFWSPVSYRDLKGWANSAFLVPLEGREDESVTLRAAIALRSLKRCDGKSLAEITHPLKGLRFGMTGNEFSPADVVLLPKEIREAFASSRVFPWGGLHGPIRMDIKELCETALQPPAVIKKIRVGLSCGVKGCENARVVEFHDGTVMEGEEGGLKLIMERHSDGQWYLTGLIPWSTV